MKTALIYSALTVLLTQASFAETSPSEMVRQLGAGINIGNVMSAPQEGNWAKPIEPFYFEDIRAVGFDHVRIPVRCDQHTDQSPHYRIDPDWLLRVKTVIEWAQDEDLKVVLNAHGEHWFIEACGKREEFYCSPENWQRMLAIWAQISAYFSDQPDALLFELINEPYFHLSKKVVDKLNQELLSIVRKHNPTRNVLITGGGANSIHAPMQIDPAFIQSDPHLIAWFHYYWPNTFTKYPETKNSQPTWGTDEDIAFLEDNFLRVKQWADQHQIPIYLGEYGVNNSSDPRSRALYFKKVKETAKSLGFADAVWCAGPKAKKVVYYREKRQWDKSSLDGLFSDSEQ